MSDEKETGAWLKLSVLAEADPETAVVLLKAAGSPQEVFERPFYTKIPQPLKTVLYRRQAELDAATEKTLAWLDTPGNAFIAIGDSRYPQQLLQHFAPPLFVLVSGNDALIREPMLYVTSAPESEDDAKRDASDFGETFASRGYAVLGQLENELSRLCAIAAGRYPGKVVAVSRHAPDVVESSRIATLAGQFKTNGAVVSFVAPGMPALPLEASERLACRLSGGILVFRAAANSATVKTARFAAECGRDVFAVPGSVHHPLSRGPHQLIREGACLVETAADVISEFKKRFS